MVLGVVVLLYLVIMDLMLNYLIVTILMTGTLILINAIVKSSKKKKEHLNPFNKEIVCIIFFYN